MIITRFFTGHQRSIKAKKHIIASFFIKGFSIIIGFLMVRVTLDYLDPTKYGIWITLSSFLAWFSFFEVGLGSGLRNKLAEALARNDYKTGRIYVSTTYAILSIVIGSVAILFFIVNNFVNWSKVLNTDTLLNKELTTVASIVFGLFFIRFVAKLIGMVLYADQRPAIANVFGPLGNLVSLLIIYVLTKTTVGSLIYLSAVLSIVPVFILIIASIYFYKSDYKYIAPSLMYIDFKYGRNLLSLGARFFLIQISGLIIFQSSNIIIAQYFGPIEVTPYNIAYKYFSTINMLFTIIISPFWGAFTEAWVKKDIDWIKKSIKKLLYVWGGISILGVIMLLFATPVYKLWIGDSVDISFGLSLSILIYFITFSFGGVFNMFINGVGKIKLQMYASFLGAILFVILAIVLIQYTTLGVVGLVLASIVSNINGIIIAPIQYKKLIQFKGEGIWGQ